MSALCSTLTCKGVRCGRGSSKLARVHSLCALQLLHLLREQATKSGEEQAHTCSLSLLFCHLLSVLLFILSCSLQLVFVVSFQWRSSSPLSLTATGVYWITSSWTTTNSGSVSIQTLATQLYPQQIQYYTSANKISDSPYSVTYSLVDARLAWQKLIMSS